VVTGGTQAFSKSLAGFKPANGDVYIFPGCLLHGAKPVRGAGERISLAVNAFVDMNGGCPVAEAIDRLR